MNQIARIVHMENILNETRAAADILEAALDRWEAAQPGLAELAAYYSSRQWMEDYEADEAGTLPRDLRRGVLSEDAVYNLLTDSRHLVERMRRLDNAPGQ